MLTITHLINDCFVLKAAMTLVPCFLHHNSKSTRITEKHSPVAKPKYTPSIFANRILLLRAKLRRLKNKYQFYFQEKISWPRRDSNTQPSDLESDALPLRHGVRSICIIYACRVVQSDFCQGWGDGSKLFHLKKWNPQTTKNGTSFWEKKVQIFLGKRKATRSPGRTSH